MCIGTSQYAGVEHVRKLKIIDKRAVTGQKPRVFAALQRLTCIAHPASPAVARGRQPAVPNADSAVRFTPTRTLRLAWGRGRVGVRSRWISGVRDLIYGNAHPLALMGYEVIVLSRLADDFVQVLG